MKPKSRPELTRGGLFPRIPVSDIELEAVLAWLTTSISTTEYMRITNTPYSYHRMSIALREAYRKGRLHITAVEKDVDEERLMAGSKADRNYEFYKEEVSKEEAGCEDKDLRAVHEGVREGTEERGEVDETQTTKRT